VPAAATENVAVWPAETFALTGCVVIEGAPTVAPETFKVAAPLTALPALLLTTTVNNARLSERVVGGVVYDAAVAPLTVIPFFTH
jgi:hypothetical protein